MTPETATTVRMALFDRATRCTMNARADREAGEDDTYWSTAGERVLSAIEDLFGAGDREIAETHVRHIGGKAA